MLQLGVGKGQKHLKHGEKRSSCLPGLPHRLLSCFAVSPDCSALPSSQEYAEFLDIFPQKELLFILVSKSAVVPFSV